MAKTTKKKRMGRPPKAPDEARSKSFLVRVTPAEHAALKEAAAAELDSLSNWARKVLLAQVDDQ